MKVFTAAQMREFDREATEEYSIPSIVLMENAALPDSQKIVDAAV